MYNKFYHFKMIELMHAYIFMGGAFVGRFTGILPSIIIAIILLYMADNTLFTNITVTSIKTFLIENIQRFEW